MPRGKKQANAEPSAAEKRKQVLSQIGTAYAGDDIVSRLFQRGVELENQRKQVFADQAKNRRSLRDLADQGICSREDVDDLYPPKGDGTAEDEPSSATETTAAAA